MTDMLQKSEDVAKNVANENSQDLTEKWRKGELPSGWYYVRLIRGEYRIDLYINGKNEWIDCPDNIIDTIVCEVPSYEEWKALNGNMDSVMQTNQALCKKLAELKELLKLNNILNKGSKAIYAWPKEDTVGEQKKLSAELFDKTVEMISEINQALGGDK